MRSLVVRWLQIEALLLLLGAAVFGVAFPILGLVLGLTGLAPSGGDPLAAAIGVPVSGCCTALLYGPCGAVCLVAARRYGTDPGAGYPWVLVASLATGFLCPLGLIPFVLVLTDLGAVTDPIEPE